MENSDGMGAWRRYAGRHVEARLRRRVRGAIGTLLLATAPLASIAESPAGKAADEAPAAQPAQSAPAAGSPVELKQLLRLPDSYGQPSEKRGGGFPDEWRSRFNTVRAERDKAQALLKRAQRGIEAASADSGQWSVSAPGAGVNENSPLSFKLRLEVKRQREVIEASQKKLRRLEIEADLAGIPETWRQ